MSDNETNANIALNPKTDLTVEKTETGENVTGSVDSENVEIPGDNVPVKQIKNIRLTLEPEWAEELMQIAKPQHKTRLDLIREYIREGAAKDPYANNDSCFKSKFSDGTAIHVSENSETNKDR